MMDVMKKEECPACHGDRLCPKAVSYLIQGINIANAISHDQLSIDKIFQGT